MLNRVKLVKHFFNMNFFCTKNKPRIIRIEEINNILEEECKKYNVNFCSIYYFTTKNYKMRKIFTLGAYSRINIHHRYEYLFLIFVNTCLKFLQRLNSC